MLARETVTGLVMEVSMMGTEAAWLDWCAGPTTVSSSEPTSTRRTTAASSQTAVEVGEPGGPGAPAASPVVVGTGVETDTAGVLAVLTPRPLRPGYVTHSHANPKHGHPGQNGQHQAG